MIGDDQFPFDLKVKQVELHQISGLLVVLLKGTKDMLYRNKLAE